MAPKKKTRSNLSTATAAQYEVLPEAEPPDPHARSPDKDPALVGSSKNQKNPIASTPVSGIERHVITENSEVPSELVDPPTTWKGKARSLSPQQFRTRETFLSPKQSKSAVIDRDDYAFPTTEEEVPLRKRHSPVQTGMPEEWTTTDNSHDLYGSRKLRRKINPSLEILDRKR